MNTKILLAATLLATLPVASFAADKSTTYSRHNTTMTTTTKTYAAPARTWMGLEGPYVSAFGGWNKTQNDSGLDFNDGYIGGLAVGGKTKWARAELEASYRNNEIDNAGDGRAESGALMANAYWDIETGTRFTPYIGGGIGVAHVEFDTTGGDEGTEFAYQGIAGASFAIDPRWSVGAEYRYFATTQVDNTDYDNHAVVANVRYAF